jgi:hypothetical protein
MKKRILTALAAGLCCTVTTIAQVPSYVPTNGLVGWWPFNGNADDESGNGNNGTVNGATLSTDRFGNTNRAYYYNGTGDFIEVPNSNTIDVTGNQITIACWINFNNNLNDSFWKGISKGGWDNGVGYELVFRNNLSNDGGFVSLTSASGGIGHSPFNSYQNQWTFLLASFDGINGRIYINGSLVQSSPQGPGISEFISSSNFPLYFGRREPANSLAGFLNGKLDDIGIWNRALTQSEITTLYQGCNISPTISPATTSLSSGTNAQFTTPSVTGGTYQWQNNPLNNGWQNVPSNPSYSGGTTNTLTVNNVQLSNHQQPFRVIVSNGSCTDTSVVALIEIADTCVNTVNDTLYTTVTDTLIINTTLSLAPPNDQNTIKIYPNPASDHITIDNGNYAAMAGYSIVIENNAGQQVFQSAINQAQFYLDLSSWTGNGLYFVHLFDPAGNTVTVRKIVLQ